MGGGGGNWEILVKGTKIDLSDLISCCLSSYFLQLDNALMLKAPKCHAMNWMENSIAESLLWLFDLGKA